MWIKNFATFILDVVSIYWHAQFYLLSAQINGGFLRYASQPRLAEAEQLCDNTRQV